MLSTRNGPPKQAVLSARKGRGTSAPRPPWLNLYRPSSRRVYSDVIGNTMAGFPVKVVRYDSSVR